MCVSYVTNTKNYLISVARRNAFSGMFCFIAFFLAGFLFLSCALPAVASFDHNHSLFTKELRRFVMQGNVNYSDWKLHREGLDRYIAQLASITPQDYERFSREQKLALWINAYNALAIKQVIENYPIKGSSPYYPSNSIRQIHNNWEAVKAQVAGRIVDLYKIEHEVLRKEFGDPRSHFVVVAAAKGSPALRSHAYCASSLERDLNEAEKQFMLDRKNSYFDLSNLTLHISQIFKWFPLDFARRAGYETISFPPPPDDLIVKRYAKQWLSPTEEQAFQMDKVNVFYEPFDWALNDLH